MHSISVISSHPTNFTDKERCVGRCTHCLGHPFTQRTLQVKTCNEACCPWTVSNATLTLFLMAARCESLSQPCGLALALALALVFRFYLRSTIYPSGFSLFCIILLYFLFYFILFAGFHVDIGGPLSAAPCLGKCAARSSGTGSGGTNVSSKKPFAPLVCAPLAPKSKLTAFPDHNCDMWALDLSGRETIQGGASVLCGNLNQETSCISQFFFFSTEKSYGLFGMLCLIFCAVLLSGRPNFQRIC
jgi:hypothetical protein